MIHFNDASPFRLSPITTILAIAAWWRLITSFQAQKEEKKKVEESVPFKASEMAKLLLQDEEYEICYDGGSDQCDEFKSDEIDRLTRFQSCWSSLQDKEQKHDFVVDLLCV